MKHTIKFLILLGASAALIGVQGDRPNLRAVEPHAECEKGSVIHCLSRKLQKPPPEFEYYKAGIVDAITALGDPNGSSMIAIRKYMQAKLPVDKKWLNATFLTALKKGVADGDFIRIKNSYKLSPEFEINQKAATKKKTTTKKKTAPKKKTVTKKTPADDLEKTKKPEKRLLRGDW